MLRAICRIASPPVLLLLVALPLASGAVSDPTTPTIPSGLVSTHGNVPPVSPTHVLVVENARSADGEVVAARYLAARHIPPENLLKITCPDTDEWTLAEYRADLETMVRQRVQADSRLEYVVLMRGIPFRFSDSGREGGFSTDSVLAECLMPPQDAAIVHAPNPFFHADGRFSRTRYGILLVTRLDGPTRADALALIESSVRAQPRRGPFYLRDSFIESMARANAVLTARGLTTEWVQGFNNAAFPHYEGSGGPYMAHWGAGPHDTQFTRENYARLKFLPGAIADITWSASAAGLHDATSLGSIAVMTANGAAGAQGYVSEPYSDALSQPEIVLERYTRGYNVAESFSMGTPYLHWKQVVLGDPLCAPYASTASAAAR